MPRLIVTKGAAVGLRRCRDFLIAKDSDAAGRAGRTIDLHLQRLRSMPDVGRPARGHPGLRELLIPFGRTGYIALYHHDSATDTVLILAIRHQREAGY